MLGRPDVRSYHQYSFVGSITLCSQVASTSALDSLDCAVSGASVSRREAPTIKDEPLTQK